MIKSDYIVLDTETGGLDPFANPMTQFACVILDGTTLKEKDRWESYIKPYDDLTIEQAALDKTMVTWSDIRSGIKLDLWASTFIAFCEQHRQKARTKEQGRLILVGHNVTFDRDFLNVGIMLAGHDTTIEEWVFPNFIDTLALAKLTWGVGKERTEKLTLTDCCARAGIKITDAHGAMNDVEATADLFRWFMKKLRADKQSSGSVYDRPQGDEFFEFKCGVK